MKAIELRIGNLVEYKITDDLDERIEWWELSTIDSDDLKIIQDDCDYRPIPLTEEWLLKFGFKYNNPTYEWYDKSAVLFIQVNYLGFDLIAKFHNQVIREIKYVHELQNLYFALTGKELKIKESKS